MKPFSHSSHPLFQQSNVGSEIWWDTIKKLGTPLVRVQEDKALCTFIWRDLKQQESHFVYIDIYSQSPSIYQKWNRFNHIAGTDVYFFEIELPLDWSGSYVLVVTKDEAPNTTCTTTRRQWWQTQLKENAQIDPLSHQIFYTGHLARYINQIQLKKTNQLLSSCAITQTFQWSSRLCQQEYWVDIFISGESPEEKLPLIIFLDGQIWSRELPILSEMQHLTQLNKIRPAVYAFVHSVSGEQRQQDYGCRDLFSQSLLYELTEQLIQKYPSISHQNITLCGQSLGGLCALYSAMLYPAIFQNLILQSGSYWWSDFSKSTLAKDHVGNLLEFIKHRPNTLSQKTQIYISAGFYETDMQEDSFQLYQQLQAFNQVSFHRFVGGHDPVNWRSDLIKALQVFLSL